MTFDFDLQCTILKISPESFNVGLELFKAGLAIQPTFTCYANYASK